MKIYTLYYKDTGLYNKSIFVMPNDAAAIKAMKLNLMDPKAINFKNEAKLGNTELVKLCDFTEEGGIGLSTGIYGHECIICNLKDLLNDDTGNMQPDDQ